MFPCINLTSEGSFSVFQAAKYKAAILPVGGAVLGGMVAGPLGLLAGLKIGGLAAAAGGVAGRLCCSIYGVSVQGQLAVVHHVTIGLNK